MNLISNAITHAPGSRFIDVDLRSSGQYAELRVADEGPGVPKAELPNIFSRFYQVSRHRGGTERGLGLGLYICREIVRAHKGEISVVSVEGKGTTFTVRLPLAERAASGSRDVRSPAKKAEAGSRDVRSPTKKRTTSARRSGR
jgi:two-component system, chemotaxis family, CheB/CheR fusion protein